LKTADLGSGLRGGKIECWHRSLKNQILLGYDDRSGEPE
jgi:hypothetical protein